MLFAEQNRCREVEPRLAASASCFRMETGFVHQKSHTVSRHTHESDSHCCGSNRCVCYAACDFKGTVPSGLLHHGSRGNRLRRTRKAMGSFRFAIPSAFRSNRRGRFARAGSEGIPSNGFSASREAGFGVFRGRACGCLRFNLGSTPRGLSPAAVSQVEPLQQSGVCSRL